MGVEQRPPDGEIDLTPAPIPEKPKQPAQGEFAAREDETPEEREARFEKMRKIVDQTPGATVFREGMKVPGQEEREEKEAEWMRGEFDPVGDLVVTGMRLVRGEGRSADEATGPQCGDFDDVFITLRGTPVEGAQDPFFAPRGAEAALANRLETKWFVSLSNPALSKYWVRSLRAMSRGDWCRFTCAAKKSQAWLQSLADCCEPSGGGDGDDNSASDSRIQLPTGRVQVQPSGRDIVVELRLDSWLRCTQVAKRHKPTLFKRVLKIPDALIKESKLSRSARPHAPPMPPQHPKRGPFRLTLRPHSRL